MNNAIKTILHLHVEKPTVTVPPQTDNATVDYQSVFHNLSMSKVMEWELQKIAAKQK